MISSNFEEVLIWVTKAPDFRCSKDELLSFFYLNLQVEGPTVFSWQFSKMFQMLQVFLQTPLRNCPCIFSAHFLKFTPMVSFYTPCKQWLKKARDLLTFSGSIDRHQFHEMGLEKQKDCKTSWSTNIANEFGYVKEEKVKSKEVN